MREILFRGKRFDNDKWIEGCFVKGYSGITWIFRDEFSDRSAIMPAVIPETIGQFTGLTDKNGKRIFEGDIVQFPKLYGSGNGFIKYRFGEFKAFAQNLAYTIQENFEVIGNIHDNPELLKGETDV